MMPIFFDSPHSDRVLAALRRMSPSGRVRTTSALQKLAESLALTRLDVDEAVRDLYRAGLLEYQADSREMPVSGFIAVIKEVVPTPEHERAWARAMVTAGIDADTGVVLHGLSAKLVDLSPQDMDHMALALKAIAELDAEVLDDAGFNVSARRILGGSKVLSQLSLKMLQALGLPSRLRNSSPRYVICAGPPSPVATLLIENPRAFENAVRSGLGATVALVCTYGFGLSYLGQEWLRGQDTSEHDKPIIIIRAGSPPALAELFSIENVYLWADLDLAAFDIFKSLRSTIPHLRLSKIYQAMVPLLDEPSASHPYAALFDKSGQAFFERELVEPLHQLDNQAARALRLRCKNRAVDQEAVVDSVILKLGPYAYQ